MDYCLNNNCSDEKRIYCENANTRKLWLDSGRRSAPQDKRNPMMKEFTVFGRKSSLQMVRIGINCLCATYCEQLTPLNSALRKKRFTYGQS